VSGGVYIASDVDGTITTKNISCLFGRFLYKKKVIGFWRSFFAVGFYFLHAIGFCSVISLHKILFYLLFKGKSKKVLEDAADQFFADSLSKLFRIPVLQELSRLRNQGAVVALLSSSPDFLIKKVALALCLEESHATTYCVDENGFFSHLGRIVTGDVKAKLVRNIRQTTNASIVAISDSMLDLPLLLEADEGIVVCPGRKLAYLAGQRGWRVIL
jgi:HAD superfamily phosphoserine phosphatase-like hydrolase